MMVFTELPSCWSSSRAQGLQAEVIIQVRKLYNDVSCGQNNHKLPIWEWFMPLFFFVIREIVYYCLTRPVVSAKMR